MEDKILGANTDAEMRAMCVGAEGGKLNDTRTMFSFWLILRNTTG